MIDELTKVDPALHDWYCTVYVCWLVLDLEGSVGSELIARCRNRTWGSRTAHKDRTRWLTGFHSSLRGLPTGKFSLYTFPSVISDRGV